MKKYVKGSTNSNILAVFWYYKGKFVGDEAMMNSQDTVQYGDYLQVDSDHFVIWPKYRKELGLPSRIEYDEIPRGRVMFNTRIHKFVVVGSKAIVDNDDARDALISHYGLPITTVFENDEHYG